MEKVAVIGGGQMGSQIAALSAMSGHETSIFDSNKEYLDSKLVFTKENIENLVSKDLIKKESLDNFNQNLKFRWKSRILTTISISENLELQRKSRISAKISNFGEKT